MYKDLAKRDKWYAENNESRLQAYKRYRQRHREKVSASWKRRKLRAREYVQEYLQKHPCIDCGATNKLHFDHVQPKFKEISRMVQSANRPERIKLEMDKCVIRCASCHIRRHNRDRKRNKNGTF
jgi:hypothetical protein